MSDNTPVYVIPERILAQLEHLSIELQSLFLEIYANHEVAARRDGADDRPHRVRCDNDCHEGRILST